MTLSPALRCLFFHNYYQYTGGEDVSMAAEVKMLRQRGHQVELLQWHNNRILTMSPQEKLALFWQTTWNSASERCVRQALKRSKAELLHGQNFFPLVSPSVYSAAHRLDVPVVQHLRNFRLGCLNAYLYRQGRVCEDCVACNPWRGLLRRCYRNSFLASASLWQMLTVHRLRRTWHRDVHAFIAPSQFAAKKLIEIGLPAENMHVKPNFVSDPLVEGHIPQQPDVPTFIFIGRLSPEKGIAELLQAWQGIKHSEWQLWIVGDGPLKSQLEDFCRDQKLHNVHFWGQCAPSETLKLLQCASMLLVPSRWYETFGRVVVEAFACGRGALVSNLGALAELVQDQRTGLTVPYQDRQMWIDKIQWCGENPSVMASMGHRARQRYVTYYTPKVNYECLMKIYQTVT